MSGHATAPGWESATATVTEPEARETLEQELRAAEARNRDALARLEAAITVRQRMRAELEDARDAALSALQAKSQFLANTSHELRTPLTSIIGMNELLLRSDLDDGQRRMAETVKRSAEKLLRTIVDILDVSALTTASLHLDAADVEVRPLVEDVEALVRPSAAAKGLRFVCGVDDDAPPVVHGDGVRIRQMLLQLATNAVTFTDRGGIVIRASRPEGVEVRSARFTVVDTGIGVAPGDQWRLFRVFSQVDPSDTRRFGGNGLGLAFVAQLAGAMGGTVGVASSPGRGSTFWFDIPARPQDRPAP
jgi:two-component system sensor histidine kinase/response regulator